MTVIDRAPAARAATTGRLLHAGALAAPLFAGSALAQAVIAWGWASSAAVRLGGSRA